MPPRKRRSYTAEYKVEAAHRVIDSGRTISEVARELGIDAGMLSVWVKDERRRTTAAEVHGDTPLDAGERAELQRLRRQVGELEKDNAFLVKVFMTARGHRGGMRICRWPSGPTSATRDASSSCKSVTLGLEEPV